MLLALREVSSEPCGGWRIDAEPIHMARRAFALVRTDAHATLPRLNVRSLCVRCLLWTLQTVVILDSQ